MYACHLSRQCERGFKISSTKHRTGCNVTAIRRNHCRIHPCHSRIRTFSVYIVNHMAVNYCHNHRRSGSHSLDCSLFLHIHSYLDTGNVQAQLKIYSGHETIQSFLIGFGWSSKEVASRRKLHFLLHAYFVVSTSKHKRRQLLKVSQKLQLHHLSPICSPVLAAWASR